jgi:hypothetical protein
MLFGTLGLGANWVLPTALLQQIPWFSEHLPEVNNLNCWSMMCAMPWRD